MLTLNTVVISIVFSIKLNVVFDSFQILDFATGNGPGICNPQEMRAGNIHHWCKASMNVLKSHEIADFDHYAQHIDYP